VPGSSSSDARAAQMDKDVPARIAGDDCHSFTQPLLAQHGVVPTGELGMLGHPAGEIGTLGLKPHFAVDLEQRLVVAH